MCVCVRARACVCACVHACACVVMCVCQCVYTRMCGYEYNGYKTCYDSYVCIYACLKVHEPKISSVPHSFHVISTARSLQLAAR